MLNFIIFVRGGGVVRLKRVWDVDKDANYDELDYDVHAKVDQIKDSNPAKFVVRNDNDVKGHHEKVD